MWLSCIKKVSNKSGRSHQFFYHRSIKNFMKHRTSFRNKEKYIVKLRGSFIHCNTTWHSNLNLPFLFNFTLITFEIKKTRKIIPTNRNLKHVRRNERKKNLHKKCIQKIIKIQSKMLKSTLWPHICFRFFFLPFILSKIYTRHMKSIRVLYVYPNISPRRLSLPHTITYCAFYST